VRERGLRAVADEFDIKLTKAGNPDRRTKIGRALFTALQAEPIAPKLKHAVNKSKANVPSSLVQEFSAIDLLVANKKVNNTIPALK
jgi:hypothetical protein